MKVFLKVSVERVGVAGEIIQVNEGYARNFLIPRGLAVIVTSENESLYESRMKNIEHRKEVIATKTSLLAQKIADTTVVIKRKMHDDGKLYGSVSSLEIIDALSEHGVQIAKNQVEMQKSIKENGIYEVAIRLTARLKPMLKVRVVPE